MGGLWHCYTHMTADICNVSNMVKCSIVVCTCMHIYHTRSSISIRIYQLNWKFPISVIYTVYIYIHTYIYHCIKLSIFHTCLIYVDPRSCSGFGANWEKPTVKPQHKRQRWASWWVTSCLGIPTIPKGEWGNHGATADWIGFPTKSYPLVMTNITVQNHHV